MCKASKYVGELEKVIKSIDQDFKKISQKQSEYDAMLSEYYHKLENANFNACEGYYLSKQLQELLRKRRIIKDEFYNLNNLKQNLQTGQMIAQVNKTKSNITKAKKQWSQGWKDTYSLEELLH